MKREKNICVHLCVRVWALVLEVLSLLKSGGSLGVWGAKRAGEGEVRVASLDRYRIAQWALSLSRSLLLPLTPTLFLLSR